VATIETLKLHRHVHIKYRQTVVRTLRVEPFHTTSALLHTTRPVDVMATWQGAR